jgi:hypothetical protein
LLPRVKHHKHCIRQHTSAYVVWIEEMTSDYHKHCIRQHTSAYVSV